MNYKVTILNIASVLLCIGTIGYTLFNFGELTKGEGWGLIVVFYLLIFASIVAALDFLIQFLTRKTQRLKRILIRNLFGLIVLFSIYYVERIINHDLIVNVPNDYNDAVALVYNVPNAQRLPTNILTLNSSISLPIDGIIFTKSSIRINDIPYTDFIRENGLEVSITGSWNNIYSDEILLDCKGKTVTVRISHLGKENGEKKINQKLKEIKEKLKKYCAQQQI